MKKLLSKVLLVALYFYLVGVSGLCVASEFPIATTSGREMGVSAATDGTNYLVSIQGDQNAFNNITAQLVSASTGALVGSRISVGRTGGVPFVSFSGTSYLMVWEDDATNPYDHLYGQLISTSGTLIGSAFVINEQAGKQRPGSVIFDGVNYFVVWDSASDPSDGDSCDVYGQFVTPAGVLLESQMVVSADLHGQREPSLAFDGTNILIAWADARNESACYEKEGSGGTHCYESDIYGQFVTKSSVAAAGTLSGGNFLISASALPRDNPLSVAFDGTRYLVAFPQETTELVNENETPPATI